MSRRPYTDQELIDRGLDQWRSDPEMFLADLNARLKAVEKAVTVLQMYELQSKGISK